MGFPLYCSMFLTDICDQNCFGCTVNSKVRSPLNKGRIADPHSVVRNIIECKESGVRCIAFDGGNVLYFEHLRWVLDICRQLGIISIISLSGKRIVSRINEWGAECLILPDHLRLSFDGLEAYHDRNRGVKGSFQATLLGLEIACLVRPVGTTQMVFTICPGPDGNIDMETFAFMVDIANRNHALLNPNPLFGTDFTDTKEIRRKMWGNISEKNKADIAWLLNQSCINKHSLRKFDFLFRGGNDIDHPTCQAAEAVLTISPDNGIVLPCNHNPQWVLPIQEDREPFDRNVLITSSYHPDILIPVGSGIKTVLRSQDWQENAGKSGTLPFCENCIVWCNLAPSWAAQEHCDDVVAWESALTGI